MSARDLATLADRVDELHELATAAAADMGAPADAATLAALEHVREAAEALATASYSLAGAVAALAVTGPSLAAGGSQ